MTRVLRHLRYEYFSSVFKSGMPSCDALKPENVRADDARLRALTLHKTNLAKTLTKRVRHKITCTGDDVVGLVTFATFGQRNKARVLRIGRYAALLMYVPLSLHLADALEAILKTYVPLTAVSQDRVLHSLQMQITVGSNVSHVRELPVTKGGNHTEVTCNTVEHSKQTYNIQAPNNINRRNDRAKYSTLHSTSPASEEERNGNIKKNDVPRTNEVENTFVHFSVNKQRKLLARLLVAPVIDYPEQNGRKRMSNFSYNCGMLEKSSEGTCELKTQSPIPPDANIYACEYCSKQFTHPWSLKEHKAVVHYGEGITQNMRHNLCPVCGKIFVRKVAFSRHMRDHSIERPFVCKFCGMSFSTVYTRSRHQRTKHPGAEECTNSGLSSAS
ncbi:zinc finger protein 652-B [Clonorchis sinensis]|uniref:Zinc finger protein 652-B n=1 Tax=Clonorchis sinensis TaxID=79923 RepID=H2KU78_CLOSI|nr:zinc finger protein 652-B [Clonorchis sinensis]